jgi:hypothetical protein
MVWGQLPRIFGHHANLSGIQVLQIRVEARHTHALLTLTTQPLTNTEQCARFVA